MGRGWSSKVKACRKSIVAIPTCLPHQTSAGHLQQSSLFSCQAGHPQAEAVMPGSRDVCLKSLPSFSFPVTTLALFADCLSLLWDVGRLKCFPAMPMCWHGEPAGRANHRCFPACRKGIVDILCCRLSWSIVPPLMQERRGGHILSSNRPSQSSVI